MPIHDWTRVDAGLFHDFHQGWTVALCNALNGGVLPHGYFALVERRVQEPAPDVLPLIVTTGAGSAGEGTVPLAGTTAPPRTRFVFRSPETAVYVPKANRISVRHRDGDAVALIEIVSPGNKGSRNEMRAFVEKSADLIRHGVHLLVVDLFPPGKRDPQGVHKAIWDEFMEEDFELPPDKPLTVASYDASGRVAYVEPVGVGDVLPDAPLFLKPETYVPCPLEASYRAAWEHFPAALKGLLAPTSTLPDRS